MFHYMGSKRCSYKAARYKTVFFRFSLAVYLEPAEHPFLWLSDSCESQVDLVLWWVAEPYLDSNWVDFVGRGRMFDSSAPVLYGVSKWFVLHMSAKENAKQKQTHVWTGTTLLCILCSRSVEMEQLSEVFTYSRFCCALTISWSLTVRVQSIISSLALISLI